jgi:hypothetical protein
VKIPHIREHLISTGERLVATNLICMTGMYQLNLCWPVGTGAKEQDGQADLIKKHYRPGTKLQNTVYVDRSQRLASYRAEEWWILPVEVTWRAYRPNVP